MKTKDLKGLREKKKDALIKLLQEKRDQLDNATMEIKVKKEKNLKKAKIIRKNIAQIITILRELDFIEQEKKLSESKEKTKAKK